MQDILVPLEEYFKENNIETTDIMILWITNKASKGELLPIASRRKLRQNFFLVTGNSFIGEATLFYFSALRSTTI